MIDGLRGMIFGGEGLGEVMGPVGIVTFVAQEARAEANTVFILIMLISVNLGVVNLLPIPALDGARLWFLIVEAIRKKPVKPEYEGRVHAIGLLLMLLLLLVISYRDILRLFKG
jgi:regulator of sigma E protease